MSHGIRILQRFWCSRSRTQIIFRRFDSHKFSESSQVLPIERSVGAKYLSFENRFSHKILETQPNYYVVRNREFKIVSDEAVELENVIWKDLKIEELCSLFENVSHRANREKFCISSDRYKTMTENLAERCCEMDDVQLENCLGNLALWPFVGSAKGDNFYPLWKSLDEQCINRWKTWNIEKLLYFIDLWYTLRLTRQSNFVFLVVSKLSKKSSKFTPQQTVQFLFYLNMLRTLSEAVSVYDLECRLFEVFDDLTTKEIGVAVTGFFKTQNLLRNPNLMSKIIDRIMKEADTIQDITLTCLFKVLRRSLPTSLWDNIPLIFDKLEDQIDRLSVVSCVHITLLLTPSQTFHRGILTKVSQKLTDNIETARLKDIEKVIFPLTLLSFDPETIPCIYKTVLNELSNPAREEEYKLFPKSLIAMLYYLSLRSMFLEKLSANVLDVGFIKSTFGKSKYNIARELLYLDVSLELECPTYQGPRLLPDTRNYLSKRYSTRIPSRTEKQSKQSQFFFEVLDTLTPLLGKEYFTCKYLLPNHSRADVVIMTDNQGKPLPIPEEFSSIEDFNGIIKPLKAGNWYALVIGGRNMFTRHGQSPSGETNSKIRQLKLIGFHTLLVIYAEWPHQDNMKKIEYLKNLLSGSSIRI